MSVDKSQEDTLKQQIETADTLIKKCQQYRDIRGIDKLKRKCVAELNYLRRVSHLVARCFIF